MRSLAGLAPLLVVVLFLLTWLPTADAVALLESTSLNSCMDHSQFSASQFLVIFTPNNSTLYTSINGNSAISGYVKIEFQVIAYGYSAYKKVIDPCSEKDLEGMCPMTVAPIDLPFNTPLPADSIKQVPGTPAGPFPVPRLC
jgi:ML-like domain